MGELRRIVITGPESSGKTTLTKALAMHYGAPWVSEMARPYLGAKRGFGTAMGYLEEDLLRIAELQVDMEDRSAALINADTAQMIFCDTDLITIRIWGEEKYGRSDPWIVQQTERRHYDLWLLCSPDMPWEPDQLRENPNDRDRLFQLYERTLLKLGKPYVLLRGTHADRMREAVTAIGRSGR